MMTHPGDDFDDFINGEWRRSTVIPDDQTRWGSFTILRDENLNRLKTVCETDKGIVGQLYSTLMKPVPEPSPKIKELVARAQTVKNHKEYLTVAGELFSHNIVTLLHVCKTADDKDADTYIPRILQSGLGLPDKSYYTDREDLHEAYKEHVRSVCGYYGVEVDADKFLKFEEAIAEQYLTRTELRDNELTYNKFPYEDVHQLLPEFFTALNLPKMKDVIVSNVKLTQFLAEYLPTIDVETLRAHLVFKIIKTYATVDTDVVLNANFDFYEKKLSDQQCLRPKWKRAIEMVNTYIGDELGKIYVEKYFPKEKQEMCREMVNTLQLVLGEIIDEQDWMSPETRTEAQNKLARLGTSKVGVPTKYHSLEGLWSDGVPADAITALFDWGKWDWNHEECQLFYTTVDRELWGMSPQTVNAYYHPVMSEIVFPAGILQPPFFGDTMAECLGGIGVVIGHEMTHAFDDQGRKYNANGELNDWWSESDAEEFNLRTKAVEEHYGRQVMHGENVNGKLTLGENIADIGGLRIALRALRKHYSGAMSTRLYQSFFTSYAKLWGFIIREETAKKMLKIDPHAPPSCRINAALGHIQEFYDTYDVNPTHKLYLAPEQRMRIW